MSFFGIFVVFVVVWWLVLLMVLPFGCNEKTQEVGHASSAPKKPFLLKKCIITTVLTIIITAAFFLSLHYGYLDFIQLRPDK